MSKVLKAGYLQANIKFIGPVLLLRLKIPVCTNDEESRATSA